MLIKISQMDGSLFIQQNVRVDAPAVASLNSTRDVVAGCISRLVRFGLIACSQSGDLMEPIRR